MHNEWPSLGVMAWVGGAGMGRCMERADYWLK